MEPIEQGDDIGVWAKDAGERVAATFAQAFLGGLAGWLTREYTGDEGLAAVVALAASAAAAYGKALIARRFGGANDASLVK